MIQAFPANGANETLHISPLPWAAGRRKYLFDPHRIYLADKLLTKDPIAVAQQVAGRTLPRKSVPKLLHCPLSRRMSSDAKLENAPAIMRQHQENVEYLETNGRHREEVHRHKLFTWFSRNVRQVWEGGLRCRSMYLATVGSVISIPSLSNSPCIRGAPHSGLLRFIIRIKSRISCGTARRPGFPRRTFQVQYRRKPMRCQAMTVSGFTISRADFQSVQNRRNQTHRIRSAALSLSRFGADRRSTPS